MPHFLELLAPAKDLTHGIAAINHGADAVYIGSPRFGARQAAGNSIVEIESLCKYAHVYNCKVYVALNTLLKDHELDEAASIIHKVYEAGADAIIIQDMGLLEMNLPPIQLFASTQTHNFSPANVLFLEKVGFSRVILARELSIEEIREVRKQTTIDIETFVHGALCVCYSGQCYMSYAISGRSGNRGECAQSCRQMYSLIDSKGTIIEGNKHLLSLRDLNLSQNLSELVDAGVSSFKIEGRLKDINYVKNITAYYRQHLDALIEERQFKRSSTGRSTFFFTPDPEKTFTRGYTPYFIDGVRQRMATFDTPKSIGKAIGFVTKVANNHIVTNTSNQINNNDGLCFIDGDGNLQGFKINSVEGNKVFPHKMPRVSTGTPLYRNQDHVFEKELSASNGLRSISVSISIKETDTGISIRCTDEDNTHITLEYKCDKQQARDATRAIDLLKVQMCKSGNSVFEVADVSLSFTQPLFFTLSSINEMRRMSLDRLLDERIAQYKRDNHHVAKNSYPYPKQQLDYKANILNSKAEAFYKRHGATPTSGFELLDEFRETTVMTTRYCIRYELGLCLLHKENQSPGDFIAPLYLIDKKHKFRLDFDCLNCRMNVVFIK